jgi:type II secretory pathway component PulF
MKLEFRAFDKSGHEAVGVLDASSLAEATEKLRQQELFVASMTPVEDSQAAAAGGMRLRGGIARRLRELAMFSRQLYALVHSGTPLAQGLEALERQARSPQWRAIIGDIRHRLENGSSLSEAMKAHPNCFDTVYVHMISAGESSGKLTVLLDRMATLTRKRAHVINTVRSAMAYPVLLASVAVLVLAAMLLFVVPRFAEMFHSLGVPLPTMTAIMIGTSEWLQHFWWALLVALVLAGVGLRYYLRCPGGKRLWDGTVLRIPKVGVIVRSFITARIVRLLGLLTDSHLPIQEILRLTRLTTTNVHYAELLAKAEDAVSHGQPISSAFKDSSLINPSVYEAIRSGEQSGQVGSLLLELADFLDEENETTLKTLTSIVEPVLLVVMGAMVGVIAMSIFLPLFDVTEMIGPGAKH